MKHWKIGAQVAVNCNTAEVPAYHSIVQDGIEIARVNITDHCGPQAKARAMVIIAAPELLKAAERVVGMVAAGVAQRGSSAPMTLKTPAIEQLRLAIARAEGK